MSRFTIPEKVDWAGPEQTHEGTAVNSGPVHPNRRKKDRSVQIQVGMMICK